MLRNLGYGRRLTNKEARLSTIPTPRSAYRPCHMPERLGIGKTKFYELLSKGVIPTPSVLGPRTKIWSEDQVVALLEDLRSIKLETSI